MRLPIDRSEFAALGLLSRLDALSAARYDTWLGPHAHFICEVWVRVGKNRWQCRNCGAIVEGEKAPEKCPVCDHPQAYFQLEANNY